MSSMETTPERRTATLSELVAEEVRAYMGRKRMSQAQLARGVGKTEMWVSLRLRGRQAIDLNDLMAIADVLGIDASELLTRDVVAKAKANEDGKGVSRDFDHAPADAAVTIGQGSVGIAKRVTGVGKPRRSPKPFSQPKPGPNHPVSAVPARKRRPHPIRPGDRPTGR
jgi:transcriptional regulator with XRE-family HTH domain